jgi:hypothetical protein
MLAAFLGCSLPFGILCAVALGSILCSFIISADAEAISPVKLGGRPSLVPRRFFHVQAVATPLYSTVSCDRRCQPVEPTFHFLHCCRPDQGDFDHDFQPSHTGGPVPYTPPPTTVEALRKRFGRRQSIWGDWSANKTRHFYKSHLPTSLQRKLGYKRVDSASVILRWYLRICMSVDGALNLSLAERAHLASANRHALRLYARERCYLPSRLLAMMFDGLRHLNGCGNWCATGKTTLYAVQAHC